MATLFGMFPFLKTLFADSGYQGPKFAKALAKVLPHLNIEIVKRSDRVSDLWSCPNAGSSSAPSLGSIAADGSPRIGRTSTERRSRSCASPQSASCSENYAIRPEVSGQTLRLSPFARQWMSFALYFLRRRASDTIELKATFFHGTEYQALPELVSRSVIALDAKFATFAKRQ